MIDPHDLNSPTKLAILHTLASIACGAPDRDHALKSANILVMAARAMQQDIKRRTDDEHAAEAARVRDALDAGAAHKIADAIRADLHDLHLRRN